MSDYPPRDYLEPDRQTLIALMREHPLATFVVADADSPLATPVPLAFDTASEELVGHLDANNPAAALIADGRPALAIFRGPSAYISPRDYVGRHLPTYNYREVHARGVLRERATDQALRDDLHFLIEAMEGEGGWRLARDDARVAPLLPHIVGFRLRVDTLTGRFKMGQDKRPADHAAMLRKFARLNPGESP